MKHRLLLLYSWSVRTFMFFLPDMPLFFRLRGFLYGLFMHRCGGELQVAHDVSLIGLEKISVGRNVYFAKGCIINGGGEIIIGDDVLFGMLNVVVAGNHTYNGSSYHGPFDRGKVIIQKGCWIGAHCTLLKGTIIPAGSVVGANSLCNKAFEGKRLLISGNPAQVIKNLDL